MPALVGASPKAGKFLPNTMLMNNTSANPTGLTALQLAAALTELQWTELEKFADKRLRRSLTAPHKHRALAIYDGRVLVHTAVEQFAMGDLGYRGGRKLAPHHRLNAQTFIYAMQGAINSLISHALSRTEFLHEHLPVGMEEAGPGIYEPREPAGPGEQLEQRDLQQNLFAQLADHAGSNPKRQAAVAALKDDCLIGHTRGEIKEEISAWRKTAVRRQAQVIWKNLTID